MSKYQKPIVLVILLLIFTTWFSHNIKNDLPLIFQKDMLAHDESSNSVVSANITRKFFPPMVRVNPLNDQQGNWMEGPLWQHIPPLFAYVPYPFFALDHNNITIEVKRLSYAFITLLTGLLFIVSVYTYRNSLMAALAATLATIFWISTPFTHELITGFAFGASDIVLAFTVVCAFAGVIWYLRELKDKRIGYPIWKLFLIVLLVSSPILAKSLLGAIPATTFFILLIYDRRKIDFKFLSSIGFFLFTLFLYFFPLYLSSPATFKSEILVSFFHLGNYEGWGRPWHYFLTNYLPQRYLFNWTWPFYLGLALSLVLSIKYKVLRLDRKDRILLGLSLLWFIWNLVVISLVYSKVPNFIYQSYLLSLFAIVYTVFLLLEKFIFEKLMHLVNTALLSRIAVLILMISILYTGRSLYGFSQMFKVERAKAYTYSTEREKFFGAAEQMQKIGLNSKDLVVVRVSDNDCWARYPIIFLTGAESKTLLEMNFYAPADLIKEKYQRLFFMVDQNAQTPISPDLKIVKLNNFDFYEINLGNLSVGQINAVIQKYLQVNSKQIQSDIERIKKDKTSCQWLVPDDILNSN